MKAMINNSFLLKAVLLSHVQRTFSTMCFDDYRITHRILFIAHSHHCSFSIQVVTLKNVECRHRESDIKFSNYHLIMTLIEYLHAFVIINDPRRMLMFRRDAKAVDSRANVNVV